MSPWVKRVFTEILPKILLMKRPDLHRKSNNKYRSMNGIEMREVGENHGNTRLGWNLDLQEGLRVRNPSGDSTEIKRYPKEVLEAIERVKFVADHLREADADNMVRFHCIFSYIINSNLLISNYVLSCYCCIL
jgi:nicotinic acetylcholine receptor